MDILIPIRSQHGAKVQKISFGIACCRINGNTPEILLICKRWTYAYIDFIHGKYNSLDNFQLIELFNKMTFGEKLDILSLNFAQMWYRIWLNTPKKKQYHISKAKFDSTFLGDGGAKLKKLINKSDNVERIWEIPKGRKKYKNESDINCAIREFEEETNVKKNSYKIFPRVRKFYSYISDNIEYINIYYIAVVRHLFEPKINFESIDQVDEISNIKWMSIHDIRLIDRSGRLDKLISPIFRLVRKKIKCNTY